MTPLILKLGRSSLLRKNTIGKILFLHSLITEFSVHLDEQRNKKNYSGEQGLMNSLNNEFSSLEEALGALDELNDSIAVSDIVKRIDSYVVDHTKAGEVMKKMRLQAGLTIRTTGKLAGFSPSFLVFLEKGERAWSIENIKNCCDIYQDVIKKNG